MTMTIVVGQALVIAALVFLVAGRTEVDLRAAVPTALGLTLMGIGMAQNGLLWPAVIQGVTSAAWWALVFKTVLRIRRTRSGS